VSRIFADLDWSAVTPEQLLELHSMMQRATGSVIAREGFGEDVFQVAAEVRWELRDRLGGLLGPRWDSQPVPRT
jgi:hypothetical protein